MKVLDLSFGFASHSAKLELIITPMIISCNNSPVFLVNVYNNLGTNAHNYAKFFNILQRLMELCTKSYIYVLLSQDGNCDVMNKSHYNNSNGRLFYDLAENVGLKFIQNLAMPTTLNNYTITHLLTNMPSLQWSTRVIHVPNADVHSVLWTRIHLPKTPYPP